MTTMHITSESEAGALTRCADALERIATAIENELTPDQPAMMDQVDQWLGSLDLEQLEADAFAGAGLSANATGLVVDQIRRYLAEGGN